MKSSNDASLTGEPEGSEAEPEDGSVVDPEPEGEGVEGVTELVGSVVVEGVEGYFFLTVNFPSAPSTLS